MIDSHSNQNKYCNSIVNELQDYMLFKHTIDKAFKCVVTPKESPELVQIDTPYNQMDKNKQNGQTKQKGKCHGVSDLVSDVRIAEAPTLATHVYRPHQPDSLFWCLYILLNGSESYETMNLENRHFMVENKEKIKMVELVRANKQTIKQSKLGSIATIESELSVSNKSISITTFAVICILHGIEVLFIDNTNATFCEVLPSTNVVDGSVNHTIHVLYKSAGSLRFECELNVVKSVARSKCAHFFQLHSINKPIKPISSFIISELIETCNLPSLHLSVKDNLGKPLSKRALYDALVARLALKNDE
jgi:hypothetical protein